MNDAPEGGETRFAGVDIGGTKLYAVITDGDGKILGTARKKSRAERGFEAVMTRVCSVIRQACEESRTDPNTLEAIGVGAPSPILPDGTAVCAPNMDWENVPLTRTIEEVFHRPVFAENDCNLGTLGEYTLGAGVGSSALIGLFVGTGLGGGYVYRGTPVVGENHMAAEIGHMIVVADGSLCGCGHRGCLEAYASKTGMARYFQHEILCEGRRSILSELSKGDFGNIKSSILKHAYDTKDVVALDGLNRCADFLGLGIGNLITLLGPDTVVIGGGVFEALGEELLPRVCKAAQRVTHPPASFQSTQIALAKLGDDAVALGAMVFARNRLAGR